MASSTSPNTAQPNPNNANAQKDDAKTIRIPESAGEFENTDETLSKRKAAQEAEAKFNAGVWAAPEGSDSAYANGRTNKIMLVSTAVVPPTDDQTNTGVERVVFNLSPDISESKQVIYGEIGDIRQAGSILIYGGSPSRKWTINAKFLARTQKEADISWKSVQLLRSWTNPDSNYKYGIDTGTPYVLKLHGYGRTWQGIPVVITGLSIEYPSDVDYIQTEYRTNVPVVQSVTVNLTEARTPDELEAFDLEKFKLGVLPTW